MHWFIHLHYILSWLIVLHIPKSMLFSWWLVKCNCYKRIELHSISPIKLNDMHITLSLVQWTLKYFEKSFVNKSTSCCAKGIRLTKSCFETILSRTKWRLSSTCIVAWHIGFATSDTMLRLPPQPLYLTFWSSKRYYVSQEE